MDKSGLQTKTFEDLADSEQTALRGAVRVLNYVEPGVTRSPYEIERFAFEEPYDVLLTVQTQERHTKARERPPQKKQETLKARIGVVEQSYLWQSLKVRANKQGWTDEQLALRYWDDYPASIQLLRETFEGIASTGSFQSGQGFQLCLGCMHDVRKEWGSAHLDNGHAHVVWRTKFLSGLGLLAYAALTFSELKSSGRVTRLLKCKECGEFAIINRTVFCSPKCKSRFGTRESRRPDAEK